jgi:hypothetical protein
MQILGLDISKASVSCCLLTEKPTEPRQFYYDGDFHKFEATVFGIRGLLTLIGGDLANTIAVMEPTGVNYQLLWGTHLARAGVEVRLVGHKELRSFREHHLGLPDKDDDADALALAIYGWDYLEGSPAIRASAIANDCPNSPLGSAAVPPQPRAVANYQPRSPRFSLAVSRGGARAIGAIGRQSAAVLGVALRPTTVS